MFYDRRRGGDRVPRGALQGGAQPRQGDGVRVVAEPVHGLCPPLHVLLRPRLRAPRGPPVRRALRPVDPRQGERGRGAARRARAQHLAARGRRDRRGHRPVPAGRGPLPPDPRVPRGTGGGRDAVLDHHARADDRPRPRRPDRGGAPREGGGDVLDPDRRPRRVAADRAVDGAARPAAAGAVQAGRRGHPCVGGYGARPPRDLGRAGAAGRRGPRRPRGRCMRGLVERPLPPARDARALSRVAGARVARARAALSGAVRGTRVSWGGRDEARPRAGRGSRPCARRAGPPPLAARPAGPARAVVAARGVDFHQMPDEITALIVDDHEVVREGLRLSLSRAPHIRVVGEASDGASAVELAERRRPDVVIMDVRMPGLDGLEATKLLTEKMPWAKVLIFTAYSERSLLGRGLESGAKGYILKEAPHQTLVRAIEKVAGGEGYVDPALMPAFLGGKDQTDMLTAREREILQLLADGMSNGDVAQRLFISQETVKSHVRHILTKLEADTRTHAVAIALREAMIE